jgi:hypothetical protein
MEERMRDTQQRRSATAAASPAAAPTAAAPTAAGSIWNPVWLLTWQVIFRFVQTWFLHFLFYIYFVSCLLFGEEQMKKTYSFHYHVMV